MADENAALSKGRALADVATDEDKLFCDGYVTGIAEFIKGCATPLTIAIQGEWGAGKSSLFKLLNAEFRADASSANGDDDPYASEYCKEIIGVATFDVWSQSIANPRVDLFESLLAEIIAKLSGTDLDEMEEVSRFASSASTILGVVSGNNDGGEAEPKEEFPLGSFLSMLFGSEEDYKEKENSFASSEDIAAFHAMFVDALGEAAKYDGKPEDSRFVVFVDGLDHINPDAAVDFMERIKTYIDCPRCVFVLAVDEKTVFDGVKKKFGDKVDERRKKMFFDKLIQVPLHIPLSAYNLDKYVKDLLIDGKELSGEYVKVIKTLLSNPTPLNIKRYINTMYLYHSIFGSSEGPAGDSLSMLLAAVILEVEGAQAFDAIAKCAHGDEAEFVENLQTALDSLNVNDGINRANLPDLWSSEDGLIVDPAKRKALLSWIRKLK